MYVVTNRIDLKAGYAKKWRQCLLKIVVLKK